MSATAVAVETRKLLPSDAGPNKYVSSVGIHESGNLVIVGNSQAIRGAAYLFERTPTNTWVERMRFQPADSFDFDRYGWLMRSSDDVLAIGNRPGGTVARTTGSIYLYERNRGGGDNWGIVTKLTGSGDDRFAITFDLEAGTLAVAAPWDDQVGADAGHVTFSGETREARTTGD